MSNARKIIMRINCGKSGITIIGTREFWKVTGRERITFAKCGRRKAEKLFAEIYYSAIANPVRKHSFEDAQAMYLNGEINWRCYKTYAEGVC